MLPDLSPDSLRDTELMGEVLKSLRFPTLSLSLLYVLMVSAPRGKGFLGRQHPSVISEI